MLSSYALVWDRTVSTYKDMVVTEGWSDPSRTVFDEPIVQRLTFKLALVIIGRCGFGFDSFSWSEQPKGESGEMSVQESLKIVSNTSMVSVIVPKWVWKIPIGWSVQARFLGYHPEPRG
jgi:hypothetical protein